MAKYVGKFHIIPAQVQNVVLPVGAEILCVQIEGGEPFIVAIVDDKMLKEEKKFILVATGHEFDKTGLSESNHNPETLKYIYSFQLNNIGFHLFEKKREVN